jgi:hypothetical protein
MKLHFLNIAFGILLFYSANSQYYSSGQDPASIKWMQINTTNFQIIYPEEHEAMAQSLAAKMELAYDYVSHSLANKPNKISVILHTQSVTSNATVVWAPKRMDFHTCPPQDTYPQDWIEQLVLHEYRHVVQIDKINQGFSKILYYIFGEQITGGILGLYIPFWLLEGDAVATETSLSNSGRGREPSFEMKLRAQVLERGIFSYDKAAFGSYKHYVPNHYIMGYHFVAMARKNYGAEIWSGAFEQVAKHPYSVTPLNNGIRKVSGLSKTKLYEKSFYELDSLWSIQYQKTKNDKTINYFSTNEKHYSDLLSPQYHDDNTILVFKKSIDDIPGIVSIDKDGNERSVFKPGILVNDRISYSSGKICWAEKQYDLRWQNRSFSVIRIYDIKKRKVSTLTKRSRYFSPDLSNNGEKIVCVEIKPDNSCYLLILNAEDGKVLSRYKSENNVLFLTPSWSDDGKKIVCTILSAKGKTLAIYDTERSELQKLLPYSFTNISNPIIGGKHIFFTAAFSGIDNIFAFKAETDEMFMVTSSEYGADMVSFNRSENKIFFSDYTAEGYRIAEMKINPAQWTAFDSIENNSIRLYESIAKQEKGVVDFSSMQDTVYENKRYRRLPNILNVHSWAPLSVDIENINIEPGVSLLSQNKLSSAFINTGYRYNINEETGKYFLNLDYEALFPILNLEFESGKRAIEYSDNNNHSRFTWNETTVEAGFRVPFNISRGKYFRKIQPKIGSTYLMMKRDKSTPFDIFEGSVFTLDYNLFAYNLLRTSPKDIYSRWGQSIELNYRSTPFSGTDLGNIYSIETQLFFPGILNHHSLNIYGAFQLAENNGMYRFADLVNYPKGISAQSNLRLYSFSNNYDFPLFYPDLSISSLLYIKRFRANIFYDFALGWNSSGNQRNYSTFGGALLANFHALRFIAPIEAGARIIYNPDNNNWNSEFLFQINFEAL